MPLKSDALVKRIRRHRASPHDREGIAVVPSPSPSDLDALAISGKAALDLRLGRWLLSLREARATMVDIKGLEDDAVSRAAQQYLDAQAEPHVEGVCQDVPEASALRRALHERNREQTAGRPEQFAKYHFIPFGSRYILHPGQFILGITFEWIQLANDLAGFVTGKSSWGRRGLIIETAAAIHPGFCGCLTLELGNVGPIPIPLVPGMEICQIFFEKAKGQSGGAESQYIGRRRPIIGEIEVDATLEKLQRPI